MPFVESAGARIHYDVSGEGEPLVLIAGTGFDLSFWDEFLPTLQGFRILRVDNRGSGRSSLPSAPFTIETMARDVAAAMDAAGFASAHIHGASLGSLVARELAYLFPDRVRSLILGATWPGVLCVPGAVRLLPLLVRPSKDDVESDFRRAGPYLSEQPLAQPYAPFPGHRSAERNATGYRRQLRAQLRYSGFRHMRRVEAPTLVLHGENDRLIPAVNAKIVAGTMPAARLHLIPNAGHLYHRDQPEIARAKMLDFLLAASDGVLDLPHLVDADASRARLGRAEVALLMTDIVGSTVAAARLGDERWGALIDAHDDVVRRSLQGQQGVLVKHTGDGVLATLPSVAAAVRAARSIVDGCARLGIELRAGIHRGVCDVRRGDLSGIAVHIVARVMSTAGAGEVRLTGDAVDALDEDHAMTHHGATPLRGLPQPVETFSLAAYSA